MRGRKSAHALPSGVRLAPGVRIDGDEEHDAVVVLLCPEGKVRLNRIAAAILRLCDGTRSRKDVIAEVLSRSGKHTQTVEIVEFLDAAHARGWIVES